MTSLAIFGLYFVSFGLLSQLLFQCGGKKVSNIWIPYSIVLYIILFYFQKKPDKSTAPSAKAPAPAKASTEPETPMKEAGSKKSKKSKKSQKSKKSVKEGAGGPKAPAAGGVAGTHDPNYQTMAGVGGDCFGADKKDGAAAGGGAGPKAPVGGGVAGTHDPNYQVRLVKVYCHCSPFRLWLELEVIVSEPTKRMVQLLVVEEELDLRLLLLEVWLVLMTPTIR